jgi:ribonuclease HI
MSAPKPHFLLFSDFPNETTPGRWRFVLRGPGDTPPIEVSDVESDLRGERLEILAVVRGLEALEQPSFVTLMTASSYVREGIQHGLAEWRANGWRWERFGQMVPVKNADLWQRIHRAMQFHYVDCRVYRIDPAHNQIPQSVRSACLSQNIPRRVPGMPTQRLRWLVHVPTRLLRRVVESFQGRLRRLRTA